MACFRSFALFNANGGFDGYRGDHFLICPPFILTKADVDEIVSRTRRVVEDTFAELVGLPLGEKILSEVENMAVDFIAV